MSRPSDEEINHARSVLERAYRSWVRDEAEDIMLEAYSNDLSDDEVREMIDERTDSNLIYTADQWTALFVSRHTDEGWDELHDMGSDQGRDAPVAAWAVLTYRHDVNEQLSGDLFDQIGNSNLDERVEWLIEEHGKQRVKLNAEDDLEQTDLIVIGEVEGWMPFGLMVLKTGEGAMHHYMEHTFIGRHLERPEDVTMLIDLIKLEGGNYDSPVIRGYLRLDDFGRQRVLQDIILEAGGELSRARDFLSRVK